MDFDCRSMHCMQPASSIPALTARSAERRNHRVTRVMTLENRGDSTPLREQRPRTDGRCSFHFHPNSLCPTRTGLTRQSTLNLSFDRLLLEFFFHKEGMPGIGYPGTPTALLVGSQYSKMDPKDMTDRNVDFAAPAPPSFLKNLFAGAVGCSHVSLPLSFFPFPPLPNPCLQAVTSSHSFRDG